MGRIKFPDIVDEYRKPWNLSEFLFGRKTGSYRVEADASINEPVDIFKGNRLLVIPQDFIKRAIRYMIFNDH